MPSNTPQFNELLAKQYALAKPGARVCVETGEAFEIKPDEFDLYKDLNVPPPSVAPWVRFRRQRAQIGGIDLFRRVGPSGEALITMYDPESEAIVLPVENWHSDEFDPMRYGREVDPDKSFFLQWKEFSRSVPRPALIQDPTSQNSAWSIYELSFKDCYSTFGGVESEGVMYADFSVRSKNSVDIMSIANSEWCYDCTQCFACNRAFFSERCGRCFDIYFCLNCTNCNDCFGCTNLKNKKFCFLNEQLTEEEYKKKFNEIDLKNADKVEFWQEKVKPLWDKAYRRANDNFKSEKVEGDDLISCSDVRGVSIIASKHVYNGFDMGNVEDSCDLSTCSFMERSTELLVCTNGYENKMVLNCWDCIDIEYSELCTACEHCFGCIGLKHKKFCIFNRQYEEGEYWLLVDRIKREMFLRGEYGDFFPYFTSLMAYNTSHADALYPLSQSEAEKLGARWYDFRKELPKDISSVEKMPVNLDEVSDKILKKSFLCPESGRIFRIVKPELEFHRKMKIALPQLHPVVRRKKRYKQLLPFHLYERNCLKCNKKVLTRISPELPFSVLCEICHEEAVLGR